MTDIAATTEDPNSPPPTPTELIAIITHVFMSGVIPTPDEAKALQDAIAKLTDPSREPAGDLGNPMDSGVLGSL